MIMIAMVIAIVIAIVNNDNDKNSRVCETINEINTD